MNLRNAKINPNIFSWKIYMVYVTVGLSNRYPIRVFASTRKQTGYEWKNVGRSFESTYGLFIYRRARSSRNDEASIAFAT